MALDFDFKWLAQKLSNIEATKSSAVVTVAGAGMSTSAGIPDFRGPSGLYALLQSGTFEGMPVHTLLPPGMPVEAIFSIDLFRRKPEIFYRIASAIRSTLLAAKPTPAHYLLRILADSGQLKCHFTQNVDGLDQAAGLDPCMVVEAHGTFRTASCLQCQASYDFAWMNSKVTDNALTVPHCDVCNGVVKPDVVLFGEALPENFFQRAHADIPSADVVIIFGASLVVQPFASLPTFVPITCDRIFVSIDDRPPPIHDWQERSAPNAGKDVAFVGTCDDFAWKLAKELGKEDALSALLS